MYVPDSLILIKHSFDSWKVMYLIYFCSVILYKFYTITFDVRWTCILVLVALCKLLFLQRFPLHEQNVNTQNFWTLRLLPLPTCIRRITITIPKNSYGKMQSWITLFQIHRNLELASFNWTMNFFCQNRIFFVIR